MQDFKSKKSFSAELRLAIFITLLVCVVASTGIITYRNINRLITDVEKGTSITSTATTLKGVNEDLLILESNVRSFFYTRDSSYVSNYDSTKQAIQNRLVQLRSVKSRSQITINYTDSVVNIIDSKFLLLDEWLGMADNLEVTKKLSTIPQKLEYLKDDVDLSKIKNKKKREKLIEEANKVSIDEVKKELDKAKKDQTLFLVNLDENTLKINEKNKILNTKIRKIINIIEDEERLEIAKNNIEALKKAKYTNFIIATFSISSIALLFLIAVVFYRYVKTTRNYNKALKNARMEAESLAMAKQNFLANMTHELRTPINSILGFTEQLERSTLNNEQKEQVTIVKKSSLHLLKVVNEVLDYSKLQAGKFSFERIIFEPRETINEVMDILSPEATRKRINFNYIPEKNIPDFLSGDPFRLQQILLNIVGNAIKFTGSGSVTVTVRAGKMDETYCLLNIEVKDTGVGIPDQFISRVFDEFEQADNKVDSKYRGTGLGLSISKKLIELQNGSINIFSKVNEGTIANIIIPYQLSDKEQANALQEEYIDPIFLKNKKILVVDDEKYNRVLLEKILCNWGVMFHEAENGKQALDLIRNEHWDMVLMDIRMPEISGIEVTKVVRGWNTQLPIIALTASNDKEKEQKCLDAGMNSFISKPFSQNKLLTTLQRFLKTNTFDIINIDDTSNGDELMNASIINVNELLKASNGDKIFVKDMIGLFIKSTSEGLNLMKEGVKTFDYNMIKEQAHKISSPCRHVGALLLLKHLKNIEGLTEGTINWQELTNHIEQAQKEANKVFAELEKSIN